MRAVASSLTRPCVLSALRPRPSDKTEVKHGTPGQICNTRALTRDTFLVWCYKPRQPPFAALKMCHSFGLLTQSIGMPDED